MILAVVIQVRLHLLGQQTSIVQVLQHLEQAPNFLRRNLILLAATCEPFTLSVTSLAS